MTNPLVLNSSAEIASTVARRLLDAISLDSRKKLIALTGGTLGIEVIREFGLIAPEHLPVTFVFGDERFVAPEHSDRSEQQGLSAWPGLANCLIRYPYRAGEIANCRDSFAQLLTERFGPSPLFDITILGMGPDGHIASLFPGHETSGALVIAETQSPKPPAERLSLSYDALNNSTEVWFVASGSAKAQAVGCALRGDCDLPVAKVKGLKVTQWFIDSELSHAL